MQFSPALITFFLLGSNNLISRLMSKTRNLCSSVRVCLFFGATATFGPGPPHSRSFYITYNDAPWSVGLFWTSDQLVAETSTWQHTTLTTNIHAPGGIRTNNVSRRAATGTFRSCTGSNVKRRTTDKKRQKKKGSLTQW